MSNPEGEATRKIYLKRQYLGGSWAFVLDLMFNGDKETQIFVRVYYILT